MDDHGENMAFVSTLYELEKYYPEITLIRQGAHSIYNESRGVMLGMYGRAGTLFLESHFEVSHFSYQS